MIQEPQFETGPQTSLEWMLFCVADVVGCGIEEVTPGAHLIDDLGADSLDIHQLLFTIEEEYEIEFPEDEDIDDLKTVQQWHDRTEALRLEQKKGTPSDLLGTQNDGIPEGQHSDAGGAGSECP